MLVMRVGGDSQELIPQIHLGGRTTHKQTWLTGVALFLSDFQWNERIWSLILHECEDGTAGHDFFFFFFTKDSMKRINILQWLVIRGARTRCSC